jgi:glycosyltransferase involved in cell wall biosynthesis
VIVGEGERYKDLRRIAGPTISFIGRLSDDELFSMYARCRALLFPGEEDFGIVPVEAQSCGRPVIAYGGGGALESVAEFDPLIGADPEYSTGLFFREQSVSALIDAMQRFETIENRFSPIYIRNHSRRFDESCFRTDLSRFIRDKYAEYRSQEHASRACATA